MDRRYSALKRLYECCSADPLQFPTRLRDDPSETLREIGVGEDVVRTDEALVSPPDHAQHAAAALRV